MASPSRSRPPFAPLSGRGLADDEVELGRISGVFGVRGEVRLFLFHISPFLAEAPREVVLIDAEDRRWGATLHATIHNEKRVTASLVGITDRDGARALKDWKLAVSQESLPALAEGEFYVWQVEGMDVIVGDRRIGTVVTLHNTPGGDLFELDVEGETEFVPASEPFVVTLDLDGRRLVLAADALG